MLMVPITPSMWKAILWGQTFITGWALEEDQQQALWFCFQPRGDFFRYTNEVSVVHFWRFAVLVGYAAAAHFQYSQSIHYFVTRSYHLAPVKFINQAPVPQLIGLFIMQEMRLMPLFK